MWYEPPVQFIPFTIALSDIDIAGTTIAKDAQVWACWPRPTASRSASTYRVNPVLRGPRHLPVAIDDLTA
ncbi:hypothetical protein ACWCXK_26155 [Streptomyces sp. NPDC001739]